MNRLYSFRRLAAALLCLFVITGLTLAQQQDQKQFQPSVGQAGKDVVWVPTPQVLVDKMLDMAKVTPQDYVIDLGSGDGRVVITAAKRGALAMASNTTRIWSPSRSEMPPGKMSATRPNLSRRTSLRQISQKPL